jgi:hypothetical protein
MGSLEWAEGPLFRPRPDEATMPSPSFLSGLLVLGLRKQNSAEAKEDN